MEIDDKSIKTTQKSLHEHLEKLETCLLEENIERFEFSQFKNIEPIGSGAFAIVFSTIFQKKKYALKDLKLNLFMDAEMIKKFIDEKAIANTPQDYVVLYEECWSSNPDKRPKVDEVLRQLKKFSSKAPGDEQHINVVIIVNNERRIYAINDLDKSLNLKEVRRRLSTEENLLLGRQNIYFYDRFKGKISRDHENNYTLEKILISDGLDLSFCIEIDHSKPSFPKIVQRFDLDKGRIFDDGVMKIAEKQAFTIKNLHEKDINIQNEHSINIGDSNNTVYNQTGSASFLPKDLLLTDEYIKAINEALDDSKSAEEQRKALDLVGKEYGQFW
ncbi:16421_t:CDS:2 [Dentiscutata heterogama]|uniref:16421_t:CDS:1 n=1 Tax=Dentiscutata heterogama TaxID=1316150 RepID=A0ACA9KCD9_9GLOM|nr:16421_t:CDS:2 [Dentiscutata heterogama]